MEQCQNCGSPLQGPFCFRCGQREKDIRRFFLALLNEAFDDLFAPGGRTAKTLFALLFQPGRLTSDYSSGRRARYLPPVRLYLITSFLFFLFLSLSNALDSPIDPDTDLVVDRNGVRIYTTERAEEAAPPAASVDGEGAAGGAAEPGADAASDLDEAELELGQAADEFEISLLSEETNQRFRDLFKAQARKLETIAREDPGQLVSMVLDLLPPVMFVLLPIFALLLKLLYLFTDRYYSEHLILALHTHSFVYLALLFRRLFGFAEPLPWIGTVAEWTGIAISIWIPLYLYLTLKNYFGQGTKMTIAKFLLLGFLYSLLFAMVLPLAFVWGVLTL